MSVASIRAWVVESILPIWVTAIVCLFYPIYDIQLGLPQVSASSTKVLPLSSVSDGVSNLQNRKFIVCHNLKIYSLKITDAGLLLHPRCYCSIHLYRMFLFGSAPFSIANENASARVVQPESREILSIEIFHLKSVFFL